MSNLIPLDQAAKMLGLSPERIVEMISKKQIFGYRDGSSWKFKQQEVERVAEELAIDLSQDAGGEDDDSFSLSDSAINEDLILDDSDEDDFQLSDDDFSDDGAPSLLDDSEDDLLLSLEDDDDDVKAAPPAKASTPAGPDSSELLLDGDDDEDAAFSKSLADDDDSLFGDSSLELAAEGSKKGLSSDSNVHDDDLVLSDDPSGSTGKLLKAMSDKVGDSKSELSLSEDDLFDDDLKLADSDSLDDALDMSSDFEDSDIVLEDSDSSSELVLESNKSGIELKANDSGISLSDSLELAGSDIDDLQLPDDDLVSLADAADSDAATLMQEDEFNLTPFETADTDESSGSQVIALDDSDLFAGDSAATLLNEGDLDAEPAMLNPDLGAAAVAGTGAAVVMAKPEAPFTLWPVLALAGTAVVMFLGMTVAYDAARNLWLPGNEVTNSGLINMFWNMGQMKN